MSTLFLKSLHASGWNTKTNSIYALHFIEFKDLQMSCCTKFWITYQEIISQTCVVMYIYYIQTFKDRSNSYCKRKKIHVPITYLFFLSQWAFKPHKMSLWGRGSTWLLSLFRYTFKHYFSYRIGPYLSFVFLMCTETF